MPDSSPHVFVLIRDLIFETKIRSTAKSLGLEARTFGDAGSLLQASAGGEPILVIADLNTVPGAVESIGEIKSRISRPVLAFVSHVDEELAEGARKAGADQVLTRSRFSADLPGILKQFSSGAGR